MRDGQPGRLGMNDRKQLNNAKRFARLAESFEGMGGR